MEKELNRKDAATEKADNREYVYVRYENDDDDEMDIYDMIDLGKKGVLILKRYIALLLVFVLVGGVLGYVKAKLTIKQNYTSTALLFVDLDRDNYVSTNDTSESATIRMLANSFSEVVHSDTVIAPVIKKYVPNSNSAPLTDEAIDQEIADLRDNIAIYSPDGTQTVQVSVTYEDADIAKSICEDIVTSGISIMEDASSYTVISIVSPASDAIKEKKESSVSAAFSMAAIFLLIALAIVVVRELAAAYKAHEAAKTSEKK